MGYLTEGVSTLVLDQRFQKGPAEKAWTVPAAVGRVCFFDGRQLHGVLPSADFCQRRVTLMIGWWPAGSRVATSKLKSFTPTGEVRPMMKLPPASSSEFVRRFQDLCTNSNSALAAHRALGSGKVAPVWQDV